MSKNLKGKVQGSLATPYELPKLIANDKSLEGKENEEKKMLMLSLANTYEADFTNNLGSDSLDLNEKYPHVSAVEWKRFLDYPVVKKFINSFLEERIEKRAMTKLGEGSATTKDAIKIKENMDSKKKGQDNGNIVVVFLPQKEYKL